MSFFVPPPPIHPQLESAAVSAHALCSQGEVPEGQPLSSISARTLRKQHMGCWKAAVVSKRRVNEDSLRAREQMEVVRGKSPVAVLAQGSVISLITQNMMGTS